MVTLNTLISHLENLRDVHDAGELNFTVAIDEGEDVYFLNIEELGDINIMTVPVDGVDKRVLYVDVLRLLIPEEEETEE